MLTLCAVAPAAAQTPATTSDIEDDIRRVWAELDRHWNERETEAFAALFHRDASFVFVDRQDTLEGHEAILARFSGQFPTMAPALRHRTTVRDIRTVTADARMVDGTVEILRAAEAGTADPERLLTFAIFGVMMQGVDGWRIQALRVVQLPEGPSE